MGSLKILRSGVVQSLTGKAHPRKDSSVSPIQFANFGVRRLDAALQRSPRRHFSEHPALITKSYRTAFCSPSAAARTFRRAPLLCALCVLCVKSPCNRAATRSDAFLRASLRTPRLCVILSLCYTAHNFTCRRSRTQGIVTPDAQ